MQRSSSPPFGTSSQDLGTIKNLKQVLAEKQSYISKLESELNELRKGNEKRKDKLRVYEIDNIGASALG